MKKQKQPYDINELCGSVIKKINQYLNKYGVSKNINERNERNRLISKWIDKKYPKFLKSYLKDHPII